MKTLRLDSVKTCISKAYEKYLTSTTGSLTVDTLDGQVEVTCAISGSNFNCGFPGYNMEKGQIDSLRAWCVDNPGNGWSFGFRGTSDSHPDSVNVTLIDKTPKMFNFHVYVI